MTRKEYLALRDKKEEEIRKIGKEIAELRNQYCNDCAPYKIGDKIRLNGKEGVISYIEPYGDEFSYKWRPFKTDGSEGFERTILCYDTKNIEKVDDWNEMEYIQKRKA